MKSTKITPEEALKLIAKERAIARTIVSDPIDDHHWHFLINQFKDPAAIPPPRELHPGANPNITMSFYKRAWLDHHVDLHARHPDGAIQLLSGTLLPRNGKMYLYNHAKISQGHKHVAILFDSGRDPDRYLLAKHEEKMHTRDEPCIIKACFATDAGSNTQWWIRGQPLHRYHNHHYPMAISFKQLRTQNAEFEEKIEYLVQLHDANERNEVLFYPRRHGLRAIAALQNSYQSNANAIYRKLMILDALQIDLPLLVMTGDSSVIELAMADQVEVLLAQLKRGDSLVFKMHVLMDKLGHDQFPAWRSYLSRAASFLRFVILEFEDETALSMMYFHLLQAYFFTQRDSVKVKFDRYQKIQYQDFHIYTLFLDYASGEDLAVRCVEMLEALDGAGWEGWPAFHSLLDLYSQYLKVLHRFPNKENAQDFYQKIRRVSGSSMAAPSDNVFKSMLHTSVDVRVSIKARKLWTDIVSATDSLVDTSSKAMIYARMKKHKVPGVHVQVMQNVLTYLQEKSSILLAFDAKTIFQNRFLSLEALNYDTAAELRPINTLPNRGEDYAIKRMQTEDGLFSYLKNYQPEQKWDISSLSRPRYAFLCLSNGITKPCLPNEGYGRSYAVLQHKVKLNSLFVPHNILRCKLEASEHKKDYQFPRPCTYFTFESLLAQVPDDVFLMMMDAVTGAYPSKRLSFCRLDLQAYIPPVNLLDAAVTEQLFIHPEEYVLTPIEQKWIKDKGIPVANHGEYIGERDAQKILNILTTHNVDKLRSLDKQDSQWIREFAILAMQFSSEPIYSYLDGVKALLLDLETIAKYSGSLKMFIEMYRKLEVKMRTSFMLNQAIAQSLLKLIDKATHLTFGQHDQALLDVLLLLPRNPWTEKEEKTDVVQTYTFKQKFVQQCVAKKDWGTLYLCWLNMYVVEEDLKPYHYEIYKYDRDSSSIKMDMYKRRAVPDIAALDRLAQEYLHQKEWKKLADLVANIPYYELPLMTRMHEDNKTYLEVIMHAPPHFAEALRLCIVTPSFLRYYCPRVPELMKVAGRFSSNFLRYLNQYFADIFIESAPSVLTDKSLLPENFRYITHTLARKDVVMLWQDAQKIILNMYSENFSAAKANLTKIQHDTQRDALLNYLLSLDDPNREMFAELCESTNTIAAHSILRVARHPAYAQLLPLILQIPNLQVEALLQTLCIVLEYATDDTFRLIQAILSRINVSSSASLVLIRRSWMLALRHPLIGLFMPQMNAALSLRSFLASPGIATSLTLVLRELLEYVDVEKYSKQILFLLENGASFDSSDFEALLDLGQDEPAIVYPMLRALPNMRCKNACIDILFSYLDIFIWEYGSYDYLFFIVNALYENKQLPCEQEMSDFLSRAMAENNESIVNFIVDKNKLRATADLEEKQITKSVPHTTGVYATLFQDINKKSPMSSLQEGKERGLAL